MIVINACIMINMGAYYFGMMETVHLKGVLIMNEDCECEYPTVQEVFKLKLISMKHRMNRWICSVVGHKFNVLIPNEVRYKRRKMSEQVCGNCGEHRWVFTSNGKPLSKYQVIEYVHILINAYLYKETNIYELLPKAPWGRKT